MTLVRYGLADRVAVITLDNPPVNGLSLAVRKGFVEAMRRAANDEAAQAIVLIGAGRGFCAGGDIREFGTPEATAEPGVSAHMHPLIEASAKPVIAAIHGPALGGGLETALACHGRVATADAKIALPEVNVGVIPLSGTQRLPRLIGLEAATEMIVRARTFTARDFADTALFDLIVDRGDLLETAIRFAQEFVASGRRLALVRDLPIMHPDPRGFLHRLYAQLEAEAAGNPAPLQAARAIAAGVFASDFDEGLRLAREIWDTLMRSEEVAHTARQVLCRAQGARRRIRGIMKRLQGKVIVTGATQGLGEGIAARFAEEGAVVVINGRNAEKAERVLARLRAIPAAGAKFIQADAYCSRRRP